jgi:hypothetical protein
MGFASTFTGSNFADAVAQPILYPSAPASQFAKRELLRLARKRNLEIQPRQINPTGKSPKPVQPRRKKYSA